MKTVSDWQSALKKAVDEKFPNNLSGTFDRLKSLQEQLDDVKAAIAVERGEIQSDNHAHTDANHRIGALIADALILAEERNADMEAELEKVLSWLKQSNIENL
jgi:predicted S18 family serine protease